MITNKIQLYLTGSFNKKQMTRRVVPFMIISFGTFLLLAWAFFPVDLHYNIFERSISNLGGRKDNPNGWIFFTIAMGVLAVQLVPIFLYIRKRLRKICKITTEISTFFGLIGCCFMFLIGVFSDDSSILVYGIEMSDIHTVVAVVGIGGLGLAVLIYFFPILKGRKQIRMKLAALAYGLIDFAAIGMSVSEMIKSIRNIGWPGPGFLSFSFWEWSLLIVALLYFVLASIFLPDDMQSLK